MGTVPRREGGSDYVQTEHLSVFPTPNWKGSPFKQAPEIGGKWAKNDLSKGASVSSRVLAFDRMLATIFNNQQEHQPIRNIPDTNSRGDYPQSCIVQLHRPRTAQLPAVGWPQQTTQAKHQLLSWVIHPHFWYDQRVIWVEPRPTDFCDWFFQDWEHIQEGSITLLVPIFFSDILY